MTSYSRIKVLLLPLVAALIFLAGCGGTTPTTLENTVTQLPNSGVRALSSTTYTPGQPIVVSISVVPNNGTSAYAIQDGVPNGWTVSNINEGGVFDPLTSRVKWGIYFDQCPLYFSYTLTPPSDSGVETLQGSLSVDGIDYPVTGQDTLSP